MEIKYISTTRMAIEKGLQTSEMFEKLISLGLIIKIDNPKKWELTEKGKALGGRYNENPNFRDYIEWPSDISLDENQNNKTPSSDEISKQPIVQQQTADTEGEKYIKDFFREAGIKYEQQKPIRNLSHDSKAYRVADFYIPKYDVYVEFFGHWNTSAEHKNEYREKMKVYKQNRYACIYIYPENLGYIHFSFDHRLIEALKETNKEEALTKYKKWKLIQGSKSNFFGFVVCTIIYVLFLVTNWQGGAVFLLAALYNFYKVINIWILINVKGQYSIYRMLHG